MSFDSVLQPTIQRFRTGIEYQKELLSLTRNIQQRMLNNLASNYPKDQNTNIGEFFRTIAKEFARLQISSSDINEYKFHSECKEEYLFQILGDSLFLSEKAINEDLDDISYKNFLIKVRNAFFEGSKKQNIQSSVSDIIGIPIEIKEVYLNLRYNNSGFYLKDTHKMFFDILVDNNNITISTILDSIRFFIDLIKPAHVIYDTRLIYKDELNKNIKCKYSYITTNLDYEVYNAFYLYKITYVGTKIYKYNGDDPSESWKSGVILNIDTNNGIITLTDNTKIVYNNDTSFYIRTEENLDIITNISYFAIGDVIKYYAIRDSKNTSAIIGDDWLYTGIIESIYPEEETIVLSDGNIIVYNNNTLVYTRDGRGEYRIEIENLSYGDEIDFKADKYTRSFQFYLTPSEVQANVYKQFDSSVIEKPFFQGVVKKEKDIPEGLNEGYNVIVENDIASIIRVTSRFYKIKDAKNYFIKDIFRYTLFVDNKVVSQFQREDDKALTIDEAKNIFIQMGHTELLDPNTQYNIIITRTGILEENNNDTAVIKSVNNQVSLCDRDALCILNNYYEDKRKYYTWPNVEICSGFFTVTHEFEVLPPVEGQHDVQGWFRISSDPNEYQLPFLPILNKDGKIASIQDLKVYLNGSLIENSIAYLDPWKGIIGLNFIPPFDSFLRIDYYYSERYPSLTNQVVFIKDTISFIENNDLVGFLSVINDDSAIPRLTWPFEIPKGVISGDELDYQMNKFPILNKYGELAKPEDIEVQVGTIIVSGKLRIIDIDNSKSVLESINESWNDVEINDSIIIKLNDYSYSNFVHTIINIDHSLNRCEIPYSLSTIGSEYSYVIIRFNKIDNAITELRPLLGHIRINFLPPLNSVLRFIYYYTYQERQYLLIPDDISRCADVIYGHSSRYTLSGDDSVENTFFWDFDRLLKYGYRYRAFNLYNTSVLNSETLVCNDKLSKLDRYSLTFSGEYLKDTSKNIVLNDNYLNKEITPETILSPEIPLFIETYTDRGYYRNYRIPNEKDTYEEELFGGVDIRASFNIIEPDNSGIIDYNSICEIKEKQKINLYSNTRIVKFSNGGKEVHLNSIDEDTSLLPFKFLYVEVYYPDREQRLNDYLDYINQIPTELSEGKVNVLKGSSIIKSKVVNFRFLSIGDTLSIKNVPFEEFINNEWVVIYKDLDYTIIEILDKETARINQPFEGPSGEYIYTLTRNRVIAIDVELAGGYGLTGIAYGNINRQLFINNSVGFNYGLSDIFVHSFPTGLSIDFHDSDPNPSNPDNPYIFNPEVSYYNIEPVIIDGKTYITNRLLGVTGIIPTSNIVDSEGKSYGYTGGLSGVTGPSGALDLGITGPIRDVNPFVFKGSDTYVVPSGETGIYLSYSESEYRVQWRNFDQSLIIVTFSSSGVFEDHIVNQIDDQIVDNILLSFWKVSTQSLLEIRCQGSIFITTVKEHTGIQKTDFPEGLIFLTPAMRQDIKNSLNPVIDFPEYHLNDNVYNLNKMIIREVMPEGLIKITEIQHFVSI